jgi:MFS transporter, ACS family, aldohexuronate transporter
MNEVRPPSWKWTVCVLMLFATMLLYMDRQTLAQTSTRMKNEFHLDDAQYGKLEMGFSWAFACGALFFGLLADRVSVRWLYPFVLVAWSLAGVATAYANAIGSAVAGWFGWQSWLLENPDNHPTYFGLLVCRTALGWFEAGQWPCALITTQRILTRGDRTFGNSILQSGASLGAIFTPIIVQIMMTPEPGSWRGPYVVIGGIGLFWMLPWLWLVRGHDVAKPAAVPTDATAMTAASPEPHWLRRYLVCVVIVIMINLTWQFFRAWLPKFLKEAHGYEEGFANYFTSAYYIATDVGCIATGSLVQFLTRRDWDVHRARLITFFGCSLLTGLGVIVAVLPAGPLMLVLLLVIGAGALGLFPNHYAFAQEISKRNQGLVTGSLGTITWFVTGFMQEQVGAIIQETHSYTISMTVMSLAPLIACVALWFFWNPAAPLPDGRDSS